MWLVEYVVFTCQHRVHPCGFHSCGSVSAPATGYDFLSHVVAVRLSVLIYVKLYSPMKSAILLRSMHWDLSEQRPTKWFFDIARVPC